MKNKVKIKFLGAAETVTGSKFYLEYLNTRLLIDCGMFQGLKELRLLNWEDLPVDVPSIDHVILTHGHLDHTGYLPKLVKQGFQGSILSTPPSLAIAEIILEDTAKIQEEEAENANEEKYSKHSPALPLYTLDDVENTLALFESVEPEVWTELSPDIKFRFIKAGHILGACSIELQIKEKVFMFSGDLGRNEDVLLEAPEKPKWADYLFLESTYGNKLHPEEDVENILAELIKEVINEQGILLIASFAVERLQILVYLLYKLFKHNKAPEIPVFIDSPMGINATHVFSSFPDYHKIPPHEFEAMKNRFELVSSFKRTWEIIDKKEPRIVIAGSGMITGGRILTYLKQFIDNPTTRLLLTGYQAEGTRGRQIEEGVHEVKIRGKYYPVKAKVTKLESLSAHADQGELLDWCRNIKNVPEEVFLIHGEKPVTDAFRVKLVSEFNWNVKIPKLNEEIEIDL
ncbi:metallo-beta-lactamase family protein [Christiangramia gaetbulicola]|uniref:Metallo-beta-lactamase family protein n=1 Tax=Christiangramia gaetbulicola TaxID=703340 RepID=A0A2T6AI79_9FLAO|nr:MBL fold metallo-hydrolase [Christiangramia gaetbulicola]PTX43520.1 metallo-beta-lactamase family protein [Christiangramia gaetbulicola]